MQETFLPRNCSIHNQPECIIKYGAARFSKLAQFYALMSIRYPAAFPRFPYTFHREIIIIWELWYDHGLICRILFPCIMHTNSVIKHDMLLMKCWNTHYFYLFHSSRKSCRRSTSLMIVLINHEPNKACSKKHTFCFCSGYVLSWPYLRTRIAELSPSRDSCARQDIKYMFHNSTQSWAYICNAGKATAKPIIILSSFTFFWDFSRFMCDMWCV